MLAAGWQAKRWATIGLYAYMLIWRGRAKFRAGLRVESKILEDSWVIEEVLMGSLKDWHGGAVVMEIA